MFDDIFDTYWNKNECYEINAKKKRTQETVTYMLNRTNNAFVWDGLPKTIKPHILERYFQTFGNICCTEVLDIPETAKNREKGLYIFFGGLGGELDENYEPTLYTVANPYLNFSKNLNIGVDCVRGRNDTNGIGLLPLFVKYASMMNENEISMNMLSICYRIDNLVSADNDRTFESAKGYFDDIVRGQFGMINSTEFFDGIRNDKTSTSGRTIKDLIEYEQYLKASWYNEIGLNSNYNMKRERMVASESQMNDDALIPLIYDMLKNRKKFIDDLKEMYGDKYDLEHLEVSLNPIWDLDRLYVNMIPEKPEEVNEDENNLEETNEDENNPEETNEDENIPEEVNEDENIPEEVNEDENTPEEVNEDENNPEETNEDETEDINININISTNEKDEGGRR